MTAPTEAKAPCPLAVMETAVNRLATNEESHCAKVADLVAAAREASRKCVNCHGTGVVHHMGTEYRCDAKTCERLRAALAAFSEVR